MKAVLFFLYHFKSLNALFQNNSFLFFLFLFLVSFLSVIPVCYSVEVFCTSKRYHGDYTTDTTRIQLLNVWRISNVLSAFVTVWCDMVCMPLLPHATAAASFTILRYYELNTQRSQSTTLPCVYPTRKQQMLGVLLINRQLYIIRVAFYVIVSSFFFCCLSYFVGFKS